MRSGRPKGIMKTGGRQKGTPNKVTSGMREALEGKNFLVPDELINLYSATKNEFIKFKLLELMSEYCFKKPSNEPELDEPIDTENLLKDFEHVSNEALKIIANKEEKSE